MIWGAVFAFLSTGLGIGFAAMAVIGAGIAGVWTASGVYLGRVFNSRGGSDVDAARDRVGYSPQGEAAT